MYSNSSLIDKTILSPNNSGERTQPISRLTIHCVVGQLSSESVANMFAKKSRKASSNYVIGKDGDICLVVEESKRSWCSSSSSNDQRAITIEVASDLQHPYTFNNTAYNKLIELTVDIMKRNNKDTLIYIEDKEKALKYKVKENELLLTFHRWFANKSCPGDWFVGQCDNGDFITKVNKHFNNNIEETTNKKSNEEIAREVIEGKWDVYPKRKQLLEAKGYNYKTIQTIVNNMLTKKDIVYIVKKGDTLSKIAKKYGTTYMKLAQYNKIANPNIIRVGQKILIP